MEMKEKTLPEEVVTTSKRGRREARVLVDRGEFILYTYADPETGRPLGEKDRLVLKGRETLEFFIIPMKDGKRRLLIPTEAKGPRMVWDGEKAVEIG
ncbi:MAG: hypothetical protein J7L61_01810 [Thermoplasmata archaeon]|nr:hypothetical protein [Thermoplasmata archaeon]